MASLLLRKVRPLGGDTVDVLVTGGVINRPMCSLVVKGGASVALEGRCLV